MVNRKVEQIVEGVVSKGGSFESIFLKGEGRMDKLDLESSRLLKLMNDIDEALARGSVVNLVGNVNDVFILTDLNGERHRFGIEELICAYMHLKGKGRVVYRDESYELHDGFHTGAQAMRVICDAERSLGLGDGVFSRFSRPGLSEVIPSNARGPREVVRNVPDGVTVILERSVAGVNERDFEQLFRLCAIAQKKINFIFINREGSGFSSEFTEKVSVPFPSKDEIINCVPVERRSELADALTTVALPLLEVLRIVSSGSRERLGDVLKKRSQEQMEARAKGALRLLTEKFTDEMVAMPPAEQEFWKNLASTIEANPANAPQGILIMGPPGTGKSVRAQYLATLIDLPYMEIGEIPSRWIGQAEEAYTNAFNAAMALKPCVLFIDELDKKLPKTEGERVAGSGMNDQAKTIAYLQSMIGSKNMSGVLFVGAVNDPNQMNAAMLRSGRFGTKVAVLPPSTLVEKVKVFMAVKEQIDGLRGVRINPVVIARVVKSLIDGSGHSASGADYKELLKAVAARRGQGKVEGILVEEAKKFGFQVTAGALEMERLAAEMHTAPFSTSRIDELRGTPAASRDIADLDGEERRLIDDLKKEMDDRFGSAVTVVQSIDDIRLSMEAVVTRMLGGIPEQLVASLQVQAAPALPQVQAGTKEEGIDFNDPSTTDIYIALGAMRVDLEHPNFTAMLYQIRAMNYHPDSAFVFPPEVLVEVHKIREKHGVPIVEPKVKAEDPLGPVKDELAQKVDRVAKPVQAPKPQSRPATKPTPKRPVNPSEALLRRWESQYEQCATQLEHSLMMPKRRDGSYHKPPLWETVSQCIRRSTFLRQWGLNNNARIIVVPEGMDEQLQFQGSPSGLKVVDTREVNASKAFLSRLLGSIKWRMWDVLLVRPLDAKRTMRGDKYIESCGAGSVRLTPQAVHVYMMMNSHAYPYTIRNFSAWLDDAERYASHLVRSSGTMVRGKTETTLTISKAWVANESHAGFSALRVMDER